MRKALGPHVGALIALLALLAVTAVCSGIPIGSFNFALSMIIAVLKTGIVALLFMELKNENPLIRITASVGLVWLMILLMLALSDYLSRFPGGLLG